MEFAMYQFGPYDSLASFFFQDLIQLTDCNVLRCQSDNKLHIVPTVTQTDAINQSITDQLLTQPIPV